MYQSFDLLARLHEVHRAIAVTPVVHVPIPVRVRVTLALKFSRSPYLDNHSSESIHTGSMPGGGGGGGGGWRLKTRTLKNRCTAV